MKTILHVVGARPNYMKIAPLMAALRPAAAVRQVLVNTGQHYDDTMARAFVRDLALPVPDHELGVGSASHAVQTARVMIELERVCAAERRELVVVVGDVSSTLAAALVAVKLLVPVAHVEAGLRSRDRTMPEEINRIVTDSVADVLLTPSPDADANLRAEGIAAEKIHFVGNIMIDSLLQQLPLAQFERVRDRIPVEERRYVVLTLHRPSNVDNADVFRRILAAIRRIADRLPVVFPVHPRTRQRLREFGFDTALDNVILTEPLGYIDFLSLTSHARVILTDSGGLHEESTAPGTPCLTLRENTERPITVTQGTNEVVGSDTAAIVAGFHRAISRNGPASRPELWDGHAGERIARILCQFLSI